MDFARCDCPRASKENCVWKTDDPAKRTFLPSTCHTTPATDGMTEDHKLPRPAAGY